MIHKNKIHRLLIALTLVLSMGFTGFLAPPAQAQPIPVLQGILRIVAPVAGPVARKTIQKAAQKGAEATARQGAKAIGKEATKKAATEGSKQGIKKAASKLAGPVSFVLGMSPFDFNAETSDSENPDKK